MKWFIVSKDLDDDLAPKVIKNIAGYPMDSISFPKRQGRSPKQLSLFHPLKMYNSIVMVCSFEPENFHSNDYWINSFEILPCFIWKAYYSHMKYVTLVYRNSHWIGFVFFMKPFQEIRVKDGTIIKWCIMVIAVDVVNLQ